jgi:hypothetical protein
VDAGLAHGAGPEGFGEDGFADEGGAGVLHAVAEVEDDGLGVEGFAGGEGGAGVLAAAALHAGVEAEELLAVELADVGDADLAGFLDLGDVDLGQGAVVALGFERDVDRGPVTMWKRRVRGRVTNIAATMKEWTHQTDRCNVFVAGSESQDRSVTSTRWPTGEKTATWPGTAV